MKLTALLIPIALLGACRSAPELSNFKPLPEAVARQTKSVETVLTIPQKTLNADIVRAYTDETVSTPLVGPLGTGIFKLVDLGINHSRKKTAKEAVAPVVGALLKFDVNEVVRTALQKELKTVSWVGGGPVTVNVSDDDEVLERLYSRSRQEGFLSLRCEYKLTPNLGSLMVEVTAHLIPKSSALRKIQVNLYEDSTHLNDRKADRVQPDNALYAQSIVFLYPAPQRLDDLDANAAQWSRNDGELIRRALGDAASTIALVIAKSLNSPKSLTAANASTFTPNERYALDIEGTVYGVSQQKSGRGLGTTYISSSKLLVERMAQGNAEPVAPGAAETGNDGK